MAWNRLATFDGITIDFQSLTGDPSQPGHVYGEYGPTGAPVGRAVKHLVHLLWNYRYQFKTSDVHGLLQHLMEAVRQLRYIVQDSTNIASVNPLLYALLQYQPFSASICSMWDIYDDVDIEPGDFGYMYRDKETRQLAFQRITTLQELVEQGLGVDRKVTEEIKRQKAPLIYFPASRPWSAEELPDGSTRYTLRLQECVDTCKVGVKLGTDRASLNTRFDYPWPTILHMADRLEEYATQCGVHVSDIMFIFNRGRAERYSHITFADHMQTPEEKCQAMAKAGFRGDLLYYFDTPNVADGQLEGYWSIDAQPGNPLWPRTPDEPGTSWGWEHAEPDLGVNIEISRKGTKMRMRYLHL
ncbi:hypothetical protein NEOLEDRAFT_395056 [Neolentinus lepideus HHB14362 ss-1]|uniref:Uncharacterized protein n=1 Tax=Neolentinus lepideus HHB14362 ss-1 TaxID=1314782 RepID=A0A165S8H0_9AGAM|nr:hypothetical protein NEOLEDRAFT_395056 [Neolentinus lepideus HHB14362 ss-1]